ncbi:WW domain-containing protein tag-325 [Phlebotomus argentipes]|uniref:WW domain-containing protein tag-325 n=1 Tax=Phlebotomus argentipes TaxID=94469 RepID=UPI0028934EDD|nr:WW domain-containing protein tag-325 [Phlebotomus argentipes]
MSDKKPKGLHQVFERGRSSKASFRANERYSKISDIATDRSSKSSNVSNLSYKKYIQSLEQECKALRTDNSELQRALAEDKAQKQKLAEECAVLKKGNMEKDQQIQELQEKLEELQTMKTSKHSRFFSLRHNFNSIFQRRKTKDELVHKKILQNEPNFRTTLDKMEKDQDHKTIPRVLVESVKILEAKFMHTIGLYRVSGNYAVVQDLRFHINSNNYDALRNQKDPHAITGIIKLLFRELEEPLISMKHLDMYINDKNFLELDRETQKWQITNMVDTLHPVARDTLCFLMRHLNRVISNPGNQNNAHTLSVVVGACIFYELLSDVDFHMNLAKCTVSNKCIEIMIEDISDIFDAV